MLKSGLRETQRNSFKTTPFDEFQKHLLRMDWMIFFLVVPLCLIFGCGEKWFLVLLPYLEYNRYMVGRKNRYFEEMEDRQMNPHGYPNFDSYVKNLRVLVFRTDRRTDGQTDGQMDGRIDRWNY